MVIIIAYYFFSIVENYGFLYAVLLVFNVLQQFLIFM